MSNWELNGPKLNAVLALLELLFLILPHNARTGSLSGGKWIPAI